MEVTENKGLVYEFGKFALDPRERVLLSDGNPVHLPAKEFETLLLLVEHNGKALTKEEMMAAIWGDAFVEEGNLAKQISRLRKIFDDDGGVYIETIPKHGYRFNAEIRKAIIEPDDPVVYERKTIKQLKIAVDDRGGGQVQAGERPARVGRPSGAVVFLTTAIAAVGLIAAGAVWFWGDKPAAPSGQVSSIAVLPLRALNDNEATRALGLGLSDMLITKLGSLRRVTVRPTSAVAALASDDSSLNAGQRLNVDAFFEGTIQQAEGRLRVNARLIRTSTGEQIWADRFEEPAAGIFALQDALSTNIAKALAFELGKSDNEELVRHDTSNPEAYEIYLRGRFFQSQNTEEGFGRSIELYQQALALDPNFAAAHAGLADANVLKYNFGMARAANVIPVAKEAIGRALKLNPNISNAYTSLALIQFLVDGNWPDAEQSLQRAIALNPSNADAYTRYGYFLMRLGRFDEALGMLERARTLNPLAAIIQTNIGLTYLCAGRYAEAASQLERASAENPRFAHSLWLLATTYEAQGDAKKAFETNLRALETSSGEELARRLRESETASGLEAANRLWFEELVKAKDRGQIPALSIALQAATLKDREQTLYWLERAAEEGDTTLGGIRFLAKFDFVREDPRYQAVMAKLPF